MFFALCFFCFFLLIISSFFQSRRGRRCGSMSSWGPGPPSVRNESGCFHLAPQTGTFLGAWVLFPGCGPGPPTLHPWGTAAAATHLESSSNTSPLCSLLAASHSDWREVIPHCSFPISDLSVFHCKMEIVAALSCRVVHRSKCHKKYYLWLPALV